MTPSPLVTGLSVAPRHRFSEEAVPEVRLVAGHGVVGDAQLALPTGTVLRLRRAGVMGMPPHPLRPV